MLVDEHVILREGLKSLLERSGDYQVIATTSRVEEALKLVGLSNIDLVVTELEFSSRDGVWLIERMRAAGFNHPILVLSRNADSGNVVTALTAGASGYLTKSSDSSELNNSMRALISGGSYIQPQIAHLVLKALRTKNAEADLPSLSEREGQILDLLANGDRNSVIAEKLFLQLQNLIWT